jgi:hypothetical protein
MPNQVRFTQLVKAAGRPHTATLWVADPAKDPEFKKAIAENRIVTIHLVNVGTKKESGEIGFAKGGGAGYLIFPKPLPFAEGTRVIGLKYELLEEPEVKDPVRIKPAPKPPKKEKIQTAETEPAIPPEPEQKPEPEKAASEKSRPPKPQPKTKTPTTFKVTIEFTATATRELEIQAETASDAIATALNKAKKTPPGPSWKLDATDVKRCD